jgi:hypothetical protein
MSAGSHNLGALAGLAGSVPFDYGEFGSKGGQSRGVTRRAEDERGSAKGLSMGNMLCEL